MTRSQIKIVPVHGCAIALLSLCLSCAVPGTAQQASADTPVVLNRIVAVVNNRAILASDVTDEIRLTVIDPEHAKGETLTPQHALQQLIARALIQQQIHQEDLEASEPSAAMVNARILELRKELPACVRAACVSDAGWKIFLANNGLNEVQVENYLRLRLEILGFVESRFRQGIRIPQEDIEAYYHKTLLPQYAKGEAVPALEAVEPRISEILLQERVNGLFATWLDNLRKQGDVEVLDPALETKAPALEPDAAKGSS